ncbi:DUF2785 domain-containing protein [Schleiferilactobacillus shenzhenensis]|uniref:Uncharacterized protein n=1 Tax=Schleiferilactobacillus shenzhenensis LY-73 TaxID=1231336 RepID=U4TFU2_9LACO|nr:DUF2785 domain-containing protein [Schleiferilactobacillus shenzhenensis]ERL63631.1 hypothetical protein L248_2502 [Schleiferilactobacillus shenzhenensis LY-73]
MNEQTEKDMIDAAIKDIANGDYVIAPPNDTAHGLLKKLDSSDVDTFEYTVSDVQDAIRDGSLTKKQRQLLIPGIITQNRVLENITHPEEKAAYFRVGFALIDYALLQADREKPFLTLDQREALFKLAESYAEQEDNTTLLEASITLTSSAVVPAAQAIDLLREAVIHPEYSLKRLNELNKIVLAYFNNFSDAIPDICTDAVLHLFYELMTMRHMPQGRLHIKLRQITTKLADAARGGEDAAAIYRNGAWQRVLTQLAVLLQNAPHYAKLRDYVVQVVDDQLRRKLGIDWGNEFFDDGQ